MYEDWELFDKILKITPEEFNTYLKKYNGKKCFGNNSELKFKNYTEYKLFIDEFLNPLITAAVLINDRKIVLKKINKFKGGMNNELIK